MSLSNSWAAPAFVLGGLVATNFVMVSLFIAVILENFELSEDERLIQQQAEYERYQKVLHGKSPESCALPFGQCRCLLLA